MAKPVPILRGEEETFQGDACLPLIGAWQRKSVRLEALGQPTDAKQAAAVATAEMEPAYMRWFAGRDDLFAGIVGKALNAVSQVRTQTADYSTQEGKELLDKSFRKYAGPRGRPESGSSSGAAAWAR